MARGATAKQSSEYNAQIAPALNAITEFLEDTTHTNQPGGPDAWWQVKLFEPKPIHAIVVYNRRDCCQHRLSYFEIKVFSGDPDAGGIELATEYVAWMYSDRLEWILPEPVVGDYVRVQFVGYNWGWWTENHFLSLKFKYLMLQWKRM